MVVEFEVDVPHQRVSDPFSVTTRTETTNPPICLVERGVSTLPLWLPAVFYVAHVAHAAKKPASPLVLQACSNKNKNDTKSHGGQEDTQNAAPKT